MKFNELFDFHLQLNTLLNEPTSPPLRANSFNFV